MTMPQDNKNIWRLSSIAWSIISGMIVLPVAGYWLGGLWNHESDGVLGGLGLGLIYMIFQIWKMSQDKT